MAQRTFTLAILLTLITALRPLSTLLTREPLSQQSGHLAVLLDPESNLAAGRPLPLDCVDLWSLELIPGISDALASEIISARGTLHFEPMGVSSRQVLRMVRGVGEKKAALLSRYLSINTPCEHTPGYKALRSRLTPK